MNRICAQYYHCQFWTLCGPMSKLRARYFQARSYLEMRDMLLQNDISGSHNSWKTIQTVIAHDWTMLTHPPYNSDLALSNFHQFSHTKETHRGQQFSNDDKKKEAIYIWLRKQLWSNCKTDKHASFKSGIVHLRKKKPLLKTRFGILRLLCSFCYSLCISMLKSIVIKEEQTLHFD